MADRIDLLDRLRTALDRPGVDGLLATADMIEDLLLLGALEDKVVIASMNRGGLSGSAFELDDRMTGYDARGAVEAGFNGAKMLTRIDLDRPRHRGHPGGLRRGRHRTEPGRPDRDARTLPVPRGQGAAWSTT